MSINSITLVKPITTHKGVVSELTLNDPTAGLFIRYGSPFTIKGNEADAEIVFNDKIFAKFASEMTGVDEIILGTMHAKDWINLRNAIMVTINSYTGDSRAPLE